jgi:hypothetical protein
LKSTDFHLAIFDFAVFADYWKNKLGPKNNKKSLSTSKSCFLAYFGLSGTIAFTNDYSPLNKDKANSNDLSAVTKGEIDAFLLTFPVVRLLFEK